MLEFNTFINDQTGHVWLETDLRGKSLLLHPLLNKGTAFSQEEREKLGLLGKLPEKIETLEEQLERARYQYKRYPSVLQKYIYLNNLHDKNEVLFYKLCTEDLEAVLPMIYTPGVGSAVKEFSHEFRQPRGIHLSYPQMDRMEEILLNRTHPDVKLIVATDGEGVLGIGDQGIGGMDIAVAKLVVYSLCGVNPYNTMPVMLDVGTDNQTLLNDPMYLGWRHKRLRGEEYDKFIDKFVLLVKKHFPDSFLHWEDFGRDNARRILEHYNPLHCMFNDDMQGTGVVTLAAMLSAIQATTVPLTKQRVVIFGAGTAGVGIADQLKDAMVRAGMSPEEAASQFWLIDRHGLIMGDSPNVNEFQKPYVKTADHIRDFKDKTNLDLMNIVKEVKPTILVGCSTVRGAFTQEVVEEMAHHVARPIIFPLSNPNENCEAIPEHLIQWTDARALIATGSPFEPVEYEGKTIGIAQCNNALSFPGIGLGVIATASSALTDNMLFAASNALSDLSPVRQDPTQPLLPRLRDIRKVSLRISHAVADQACLDGVANIMPSTSMAQLINQHLWQPIYRPIYPKGQGPHP